MSNQLWLDHNYTNNHDSAGLLPLPQEEQTVEWLPGQDNIRSMPISVPGEAIPDMPEALTEPAQSTRRNLRKLLQTLHDEVQEFHLRLELANLLLSPLPMYVGGRLRSYVLRWIGFDIGPGTMMWGMPRISGRGNLYRRLKIGRGCMFNIGCSLDLGSDITIGDMAIFGHEVMLLTTTHMIGSTFCRCDAPQKLPVTIGAGTWIGARCTILPGVTIGAGAVVAAGSVVNKDVASNTLVAGTPARLVKHLD
jgi:maltose O-acetyltransferase